MLSLKQHDLWINMIVMKIMNFQGKVGGDIDLLD